MMASGPGFYGLNFSVHVFFTLHDSTWITCCISPPATCPSMILQCGASGEWLERLPLSGMPSFDWKMNDQQMVDMLNYVRNSWGNAAGYFQP
jgi:hypothetical protein